MFPEISNTVHTALYRFRLCAAAVVLITLLFVGGKADAAVKQKEFSTPEEAVKALISAVKANDEKELLAIFGPVGKELIASGDPVSDAQRREKFSALYTQKNSLTQEGDTMVLVVGETDWPFPVPLAKKGDQWFFDTKAGKEEILNRRIGENELNTIQSMLALVDAQREYAMQDVDGDGILEYAEKFRSDTGKKNGLYWETKEGEAPSPLGELIAGARAEGYTKTGTKDNPVPFHGYFFRMLQKQGKHAPGGAFDYLVKGQQIGGFAVIASPAAYGSSGVMTFIVNHEGVVYQKDLGPNTAKAAKKITAFDPDTSWQKVETH